MTTIRKRFIKAVFGRIHRTIEPDPYPGNPGVSEYDASVMIQDANRRAFEDVEHYGPGAEAANARRAATLARMNSRIPAKVAETSSPSAKTTKAERLERRAAKLRKEIAALKAMEAKK
jgi:hypothetical protein